MAARLRARCQARRSNRPLFALAERGWRPDCMTVRRRDDMQVPVSTHSGQLVVLGAARLGREPAHRQPGNLPRQLILRDAGATPEQEREGGYRFRQSFSSMLIASGHWLRRLPVHMPAMPS